MAITTIEQANVALGQAATMVDLHDNILGKVLKARADFELGMVKKPEGYDALGNSNKLKEVASDIRDFEKRLTLLSRLDTFEQYRRKVITGQHMLEVLTQFQERIDQQSFLLGVYSISGLGPQHRLADKEEYDEAKEVQKIENLCAQYEVAAEAFVAFIAEFDIGEEPSLLEFASILT